VLVPIVVRPVKLGYELACGERRLRASRDLKLKTIPAIVRDLTTPQMVELALIENLVRNDLCILEEAEAFDRLKHEFDVRTDRDLAERLGVPVERVERYVRLARLPMLLKKALLENVITEGQALLLASQTDPKDLRAWLANTIHEKLTEEELRKRMAAGA
jgi:ParB family chromosome partitioning protein